MILNTTQFTAWDRTHGDHIAITYQFDSEASLKKSLSSLKAKHKDNTFYYKKKKIDRGSFVDYYVTFHLGKKDYGSKWANKKND